MTALFQRLYFTSDPVAVIPLTMGHLHCVLSRQVTAKPLSHHTGCRRCRPWTPSIAAWGIYCTDDDLWVPSLWGGERDNNLCLEEAARAPVGASPKNASALAYGYLQNSKPPCGRRWFDRWDFLLPVVGQLLSSCHRCLWGQARRFDTHRQFFLDIGNSCFRLADLSHPFGHLFWVVSVLPMHLAMEVLVSAVRVAVYQGPCDTRCFPTQAPHHPAWFLWFSRLFFFKAVPILYHFWIICVCYLFWEVHFQLCLFFSNTCWSPQEILFSALSIQGLEPQHSYFWRLLCMLTYHLSGLYFFGCCNITCKIPPRQSLCRYWNLLRYQELLLRFSFRLVYLIVKCLCYDAYYPVAVVKVLMCWEWYSADVSWHEFTAAGDAWILNICQRTVFFLSSQSESIKNWWKASNYVFNRIRGIRLYHSSNWHKGVW